MITIAQFGNGGVLSIIPLLDMMVIVFIFVFLTANMMVIVIMIRIIQLKLFAVVLEERYFDSNMYGQ
jgi:hypothetical protein